MKHFWSKRHTAKVGIWLSSRGARIDGQDAVSSRTALGRNRWMISSKTFGLRMDQSMGSIPGTSWPQKNMLQCVTVAGTLKKTSWTIEDATELFSVEIILSCQETFCWSRHPALVCNTGSAHHGMFVSSGQERNIFQHRFQTFHQAASSCSSRVVHISATSNDGAHASGVARDRHDGLNLGECKDLRVAKDILDCQASTWCRVASLKSISMAHETHQCTTAKPP